MHYYLKKCQIEAVLKYGDHFYHGCFLRYFEGCPRVSSFQVGNELLSWCHPPQLQIGLRVSWKLCQNLCSRRWLRPNLSLVINLIPLGLWQLKLEFEDGLINFKKLFLKAEKVLEFLFFKSKSFHSVTVDGKKKNL